MAGNDDWDVKDDWKDWDLYNRSQLIASQILDDEPEGKNINEMNCIILFQLLWN